MCIVVEQSTIPQNTGCLIILPRNWVASQSQIQQVFSFKKPLMNISTIGYE